MITHRRKGFCMEDKKELPEQDTQAVVHSGSDDIKPKLEELVIILKAKISSLQAKNKILLHSLTERTKEASKKKLEQSKTLIAKAKKLFKKRKSIVVSVGADGSELVMCGYAKIHDKTVVLRDASILHGFDPITGIAHGEIEDIGYITHIQLANVRYVYKLSE